MADEVRDRARCNAFASASTGPLGIEAHDIGGSTLTGVAIGGLILRSHTLVFGGGSFATRDCWPCANDRFEVIAFHSTAGSLEACVVRIPHSHSARPIVRWLDGRFEDRVMVEGQDDRVPYLEDDELPSDPIAILDNVLYVNAPAARWYLGVDVVARANALVILTA